MADPVAASPVADAADAIAMGPAPATVSTRAVVGPAIARELRIDLFRGLALWLIFIDHMSPDLLTWSTIRNYGFSDATEIFIFISGYTAALVYGRAMLELGFVIATARILRRVWQIYLAHVFLFTVFLAEISYLAAGLDNPLYSEEMGVTDFLRHPGVAIVQTLLLNPSPQHGRVAALYRADVLSPLHSVADEVASRSDAGAVGRALCDEMEVRSVSDGLSERLLVFQSVCLAIAVRVRRVVRARWRRRLSGILSSPVTLWISAAYLLAAFGVTMTWYFPQLGELMPHRLEQWIYPIDKPDLDVLRFVHFLAMAAVTLRFAPRDWPVLRARWLWPMILCGQHSLVIFCLGVFLAFAGYYLLTEISAGIGLHFLVGIAGILIMSAVAWMASWYKRSDARMASRPGGAGGNADIVGG